jgi:3-mercaptopyruvate sulfurtransferase SseA
VAYELMDMGFTDVYVLKGGWWEWLGAGFPIEPK